LKARKHRGNASTQEAKRYLRNAREILKGAPGEDNIYTDLKPVKEACGTAHLAVLIAIDKYLMKRGVSEDRLPQSVDGYRKAIKKYLTVHNGKLAKNFERIYKELRIAGYYRGLLTGTDTVKDAIRAATKKARYTNRALFDLIPNLREGIDFD
jgi:hypothetical protein